MTRILNMNNVEISNVTGPEHFKKTSNTHNTKLIVKYQQGIFDITSLLAQNVDFKCKLCLLVSPTNLICTDSNVEIYKVKSMSYRSFG